MIPSAQAIANHLWQSTLFAVVTAILTPLLHKNQARVRYGLWLAASLKFFIPCSLLVEIGNHLGGWHLRSLGPSGFYSVVLGIGQPFTFVVETNASAWNHMLWLLVAAVWLSGALTVLSLWLLRWRRVVATVNRSEPIRQGRELDALRSVEQSSGRQTPISLLSSKYSLEPGIFGILRPVLLWPQSISGKLGDSQLKAILAHEISHVRRHDNLAALLQMAVEAVFWFDPIVWWLGARLLEERERACDEEVLRLGHPAADYAEGILKICEHCVGSPLICVAGVTGADLKNRVVRIMTESRKERLSPGRRFLLACLGIAAVTGPILFGVLNVPPADAQSAATPTDAAPATHVYHVGGDVLAPKLVFAPDPEYTEAARRAKYQGVCVISMLVNTEGKPERVQVVRPLGKGLDKKAVEAVKQYKFEPATLHGNPVVVDVKIEVNFRVY